MSANQNIAPRLSVRSTGTTKYSRRRGHLHYYARLYVAQDEHGQKLTWDAHRRIDQEEADFLNTQDSGTTHKEGELSNRFNSEAAAREAGLELARRIWGPGQKILFGEEHTDEALVLG